MTTATALPEFEAFKTWYAENRERFKFVERREYDEMLEEGFQRPLSFRFKIERKENANAHLSYDFVTIDHDTRKWKTSAEFKLPLYTRHRAGRQFALSELTRLHPLLEVAFPQAHQALAYLLPYGEVKQDLTIHYCTMPGGELVYFKASMFDKTVTVEDAVECLRSRFQLPSRNK